MRVMGRLQVANDVPEEKDLVLGDPWFWDAEKGDWFAENTRYIFIPAGKIESISLSPGGDEVALTGLYGELMATTPEVEANARPKEHRDQQPGPS
jgi:hypothetical protein